MPATFNATATLDKASYNVGETMTITVGGTVVVTNPASTSTVTVGPFNIPVTSDATGATGSAPFAAQQVTLTTPGTSTTEGVLIDAAAGSTLSLGGRTWTVSADRKKLTAVA